MKKELEIEKENKELNKVIEVRKKLKQAELYLQLEQNTKNCLEKIEFYIKNKAVALNQPSSVPTNLKAHSKF